jgi:hypothetical protein
VDQLRELKTSFWKMSDLNLDTLGSR